MTLESDQCKPSSPSDRPPTNEAADAIAGSRRSISKRHEPSRLKAAVRGLGGRVVDRRTTLGKALAEWRQELIRDLGGPEVISAQKRAIVDLAVRTKLLLDSIDAWLLTQPSLVNKRARALLPAVRERQQFADGLSRYLQALGLERSEKPGAGLIRFIEQLRTAEVPPDPRLALLRDREALAGAERPEAVAARPAPAEAECQTHEEAARGDSQAREDAARAERECRAQEVERRRNRPIRILTASRWLGESPERTLMRVMSGKGLTAVRLEDGSTRVRASDVEQLIRTDAQRYHTPSTSPCGIGDGQSLPIAQWALIFGSAHPPYIVVNEPLIPCPRCGHALEAGPPGPDASVPYRCSTHLICDYQAVRQADAWRQPPAFWGPWSAPPPEHMVERRVEAVTFAEARAYFADPEAAVMPDFEIPRR